jgi:hypothetical protein
VEQCFSTGRRVERLQRREAPPEAGSAGWRWCWPGTRDAPLSGAWVLEGSSKLARSIGDDSDVLDPFRTLLEHEPLEVGERLRDGEPA